MAALGSIAIACPACAEPIIIRRANLRFGQVVDGVVEVVADLDETAIDDHIEQHLEHLA